MPTTATAATRTPRVPPSSVIGTPPPQDASSAVPVLRFDGHRGANSTTLSAASRYSRDALFDRYIDEGEDAVKRGYIRCEATPIRDGCRLTVNTFHAKANDKLTLQLIAEVLNPKTNELRTVTLATLADRDNVNGNKFKGELKFDIKYDDLNKFLQARSPNLKITPGVTTLAVAALFQNGHQAGGFGRGGTFRLPGTAAASSVNSTSRRGTDEADLPLDLEVPFPPTMVSQIPPLKADGGITTRLESELKGSATKAEMNAAIKKMYDLAAAAERGDKSTVSRILGPGWTIEAQKRYWIPDDGSRGLPGKPGTGVFKGYRVDEDGLPIQDPMRDQYMDDPQLRMTRLEGAIRLRSNKQATNINVKPGKGRRDDKTGITQRIEVGIDLKPDATVKEASTVLNSLGSGAWSGTVFNQAQREVTKLDPSLVLSNALTPWLDVLQDRHKFVVKNEVTGVEIEFSLDKVKATTTRPEHKKADGSPRQTEFYVLEAELDHLQLASSNQQSYRAGSVSSSQHFTNDAQQDGWLKVLGQDATLDIEPRLHELGDLENASFRSTASYKAFESAVKNLVPAIFPNGLGFGRQKAAHAADLLGLAYFDGKKLLAGVEEAVRDAGFAWTPKLEQGFQQAIADPAKRKELEDALASNVRPFAYKWIRAAVPNVPLDYDVPKLKKRVRSRLEEAGFDWSAEIESMFDGLTASKLAPDDFDRYLNGLQGQRDDKLLAKFAQALGVSPVPVAKPNVSRLLGNTIWGAMLRKNLKDAGVSDDSISEVEQFLKDYAKVGATMHDVRAAISSLGSNPQARLDNLRASLNMSAPAPVLKASGEAMVSAAQNALTYCHFIPTDELKSFFDQYAKRVPLAQALNFAQGLSNDADHVLAREAARMGLPAPKLDHDWASIDAMLAAAAASASVVYDDGLKKFFRTAIELGLPAQTAQNLVNRLGTYPDLETALRQSNVFLPGVSVPKVQFDSGAIEGKIQTSLNTHSPNTPNLISQRALKKFVDQLIAEGVSPGNLGRYADYCWQYGAEQAASYMNVGAIKPIPLPYDVSVVTDALKKAFGNEWNTKLERYVASALPKALENPRFVMSSAFGNGLTSIKKPNVVASLAKHSGIPAPEGL